MPHQNEHLLRQTIFAEIAIPVGDSWIYCTLPFNVLPQPGNRLWLGTEFDVTIDRVEFIHNGTEPPYITITTKRITLKERDAHINFLNQFGFSEASNFAKHVE